MLLVGVCVLVGTVTPRHGSAQTATTPGANAPSRVEGRITVARAYNGGDLGSSADAVFSNSPLWGTRIASDGPCTLFTRAVKEGLSAGTLTITGTAQPITLEESRPAGAVRYRPTAPVPSPAFADGATIKVEATGGADVSAFTSSVNVPPELLGYSPPASLTRGGYTATWKSNSGTEIMIVIVAVGRSFNDGVVVMCRVPDNGTFTVPASTFALIPPAFTQVVMVVARVAETVQTVGDARIVLDAVSSIGSGPFPLTPAEAAPATPSAPMALKREPSPRTYFGMGVGFGGFSRNGDAPPFVGSNWRLQLGQRLGRGLHLVEEVNLMSTSYFAPYPMTTAESQLSMGAGVRWTPFKPAPIPARAARFLGSFVDIRAFYLTAALGANLRERFTFPSATETAETSAWSPMASLALGLLVIQGHDWSLGPEFREQIAYYDGQLQRGWSLTIAIYLNTW